MKLSTIIQSARSGELRDLNDNLVTDEKIVDYVNMALIALYSKFDLKYGEAILTLQDGKSLYKLDGTDTDVVVDGSTVENYSVMTIVKAYDDEGEIPLNSESQDKSVFTPTYNTVQVPDSATGAYVSILFKANPTLIVYTEGMDTTAVEVEIPHTLLEAMLVYVGYRAHASYSDDVNDNNSPHFGRYLMLCNKALEYGAVPSDDMYIANEVKGFTV